MGSAMLSGWLQSPDFAASRFTIVEPSAEAAHAFHDKRQCLFVSSLVELPKDFVPDLILIAIKPQMLDAAAPAIATRFPNTSYIVSIAAGKTTGYFSALFPQSTIIRSMPNTPGMVGAGVTALYSPSKLTESQRRQIDALFAALGYSFWLEQEEQMDAVTAISGSGPAYVFLMMEALREAGIALGLPLDVAEKLGVLTVHGSGVLASSSNDNPETLRRNVTSPGGTTEAALKVLMQEKGLQALIENAALAAAQRAKELA